MIQRLYQTGIVPVIKLEEVEKAEQLAEALLAGGIDFAEVTFRAAGADLVIKRIKTAYPEMVVGAGTVLTMEEAKKAVAAGAEFLVSPGFDQEIVAYAKEQGVMMFPGCVTPTEIQMALKQGLEIVKFFPAAQFGGLKTIKALAGPFGKLKFMPTGGISLDNLGEFLKENCIIACGGSFMVKESFIKENRWDEITALSREARELVDQLRKV